MRAQETQRDITQRYLNELGQHSLLSPDDERYYARKSLQGDAVARHQMIKGNLRLVVKIARWYLHRGVPFSDLIEEGNLGLIHAVEKFDPERGFRFSTYATWWIRQSIERAIMHQTRLGRLNMVSDLTFHSNFLDTVADASVGDPITEIFRDELQTHFKHWLVQLPPKYQEVIVRRYGLLGHNTATLKEIGEAVGVTCERVRQIQVEALKRLRVFIAQEDGAE